MRRREFIAGLGTTAWPLAANAQQSDRIRLVGILNDGLSGEDPGNKVFMEALAQLGWVEDPR
jgi:hypothetical protein